MFLIHAACGPAADTSPPPPPVTVTPGSQVAETQNTPTPTANETVRVTATSGRLTIPERTPTPEVQILFSQSILNDPYLPKFLGITKPNPDGSKTEVIDSSAYRILYDAKGNEIFFVVTKGVHGIPPIQAEYLEKAVNLLNELDPEYLNQFINKKIGPKVGPFIVCTEEIFFRRFKNWMSTICPLYLDLRYNRLYPPLNSTPQNVDLLASKKRIRAIIIRRNFDWPNFMPTGSQKTEYLGIMTFLESYMKRLML